MHPVFYSRRVSHTRFPYIEPTSRRRAIWFAPHHVISTARTIFRRMIGKLISHSKASDGRAWFVYIFLHRGISGKIEEGTLNASVKGLAKLTDRHPRGSGTRLRRSFRETPKWKRITFDISAICGEINADRTRSYVDVASEVSGCTMNLR